MWQTGKGLMALGILKMVAGGWVELLRQKCRFDLKPEGGGGAIKTGCLWSIAGAPQKNKKKTGCSLRISGAPRKNNNQGVPGEYLGHPTNITIK